jgi:hypothetical protein
MKRRSTANQQAAGISLFPFLAVLLCTMGAMIIVLVVIARHTRVKVAEEARRAAATGQAGELAAKHEELQWRIDELRKSREATEKLLADKQTELSHLEEHARRLKDQLEEAAAAREHFSELAAGDARENEDLRKRLARARVDADRTRAEIDELNRKGGSGESYAIIPYHGPNETHRKPIYIECRGDSIVLQPEGVELAVDQDFTVDLGPSNPLVSALRAATDYHNRAALAGRGGGGTPYPLFIIRPDGINSWHVARMAVSSWGTDFGYELVGQDWKFDFPQADSRLAVTLREAVAEAKARQEMLARVAPRLSHSTGHAVFRASQRGGIVQVEGSSGGSGRRGRGRPVLGSRRGGAGGDGFGPGGPGFGGTPQRLLATSPQAMGDGPVHSIDGDDNPYTSALAGTGTGKGGGGPASGGRQDAGGTPGTGGASGGGRYAVTTPGTGLAGGPGRRPGTGPGQKPGLGQQSGGGGGYARQPGGGGGEQGGPGREPGTGLAQSGSRGTAGGRGVANGSSSGAGALPAGNTLAMGGPFAGGNGPRYAGGNGLGRGGKGTGPGEQGGPLPDGGQGNGTQPGSGPGGTQPGATQLGGQQPGGTGTNGTGTNGTGTNGTGTNGTGTNGTGTNGTGPDGTGPNATPGNRTVPGGSGSGGQVAGAAAPGQGTPGPTTPDGSGNARQAAGEPSPGIDVPGKGLARTSGKSNSRSSSGSTGSGTSDPNGTDSSDGTSAGGLDVAASPNGLTGARVIDNGAGTSESVSPLRQRRRTIRLADELVWRRGRGRRPVRHNGLGQRRQPQHERERAARRQNPEPELVGRLGEVLPHVGPASVRDGRQQLFDDAADARRHAVADAQFQLRTARYSNVVERPQAPPREELGQSRRQHGKRADSEADPHGLRCRPLDPLARGAREARDARDSAQAANL